MYICLNAKDNVMANEIIRFAGLKLFWGYFK